MDSREETGVMHGGRDMCGEHDRVAGDTVHFGLAFFQQVFQTLKASQRESR